jgi:GTP-binding protein Era
MNESSSNSQNIFHSGFVAVVGRTNVGKSTLINSLLGQPVAAVSPRPQTTRRRQLGILTLEHCQIIFVDTPGLHRPTHKLGEKMNQEAKDALEDSDLILFIVDLSTSPQPEDRLLAGLIGEINRPASVLMALNKVDLLTPEQILSRTAEYQLLLQDIETIHVSAISAKSAQHLLEQIIRRMPEGPEYYPADQITDLYERDIAADLIRAAALLHLRDEIPHGIAVRIDQFQERDEHGAYIEATIFVERESHKGIVIGQKGAMLKKIGTTARMEIEAMNERRVFLDLHVKVRRGWRDDEQALKSFGFQD